MICAISIPTLMNYIRFVKMRAKMYVARFGWRTPASVRGLALGDARTSNRQSASLSVFIPLLVSPPSPSQPLLIPSPQQPRPRYPICNDSFSACTRHYPIFYHVLKQCAERCSFLLQMLQHASGGQAKVQCTFKCVHQTLLIPYFTTF